MTDRTIMQMEIDSKLLILLKNRQERLRLQALAQQEMARLMANVAPMQQRPLGLCGGMLGLADLGALGAGFVQVPPLN